MKKIGVFTNLDRDHSLVYTKILIDCINNNGGQAIIPSEIAEILGMQGGKLSAEDVIGQSDVIICLGGDGTFIKVARMVIGKEIPMTGINLGSLGFLTEIDKNEINKAVDNIIHDRYKIEERMMLEMTIYRNNKIIAKDTALNDIVISKMALARILHVKTYLNHLYVETFPGDGLIIATPTGSTAYSLSAGGPMMEPDANIIIVTPICPHILYSRSLITTGDREVKAVLEEHESYEAMVTVDGQFGYNIHGGDSIEIKRSSNTIKLMSIYSKNFFNILRKKIYDRGECLRDDEI